MGDANDRFEEKAKRFYKDTLMLPPGKDSATNDHTYEERRIAWEVWCKQEVRIAELQDALNQLDRITADRDDWEGRYNSLYANGPLHRAEQQLTELQAKYDELREAARTARENLMYVLCDPEGKACIDGSAGDLSVINEALALLTNKGADV